MKKRGGNNNDTPAELAWKNFEKTGNVSYYLLYKKLSDE